MMKTVRLVSRIFTGLIFVFSGFVKAVDPMGFAIKLDEYFDAFHLGFLHFSAMPIAIIMCAAELMIGLNLLVGIRIKFTTWLLLIFMSYFTVLTFFIALFNPVTDCGCFGDAIKLTNWQTFGKNVILIIPTIILFINRRENLSASFRISGWSMAGFHFAVGCALSVYALLFEPLVDFRPYKTGTHIADQMIIPEGAPMDVYENTLIYEKDGVKKEFTEKNFPWQDSTWKWVETKRTRISQGYVPPIHDFLITSSAGEDITNQLLTDTSYIFLFILPQIEKANSKGLEKINSISLRSRELGIKVFALTSSVTEQVNSFMSKAKPSYEICTADETTLKTMARTNPAVILLLKGTVIGKWSYRNVPDEDHLKTDLTSVVLLARQKVRNFLSVFLLILFTALVYTAFYVRRS